MAVALPVAAARAVAAGRGSRPGAMPERTCVACRRRAEKMRLVRMTVVDGKVEVDAGQRRPGRGVYVCARPRCLRRGIARGAIVRGLRGRGQVDDAAGLRAAALAALERERREILARGLSDGRIRRADGGEVDLVVGDERVAARLAQLGEQIGGLTGAPDEPRGVSPRGEL